MKKKLPNQTNHTINNFGFTLVELLLYVGILAIFIPAAMTLHWQMIEGQQLQESQVAVTKETDWLHHKIASEIRQAQAINLQGPADICIETITPENNPTRIYQQGENLLISRGGNSDCTGQASTTQLNASTVKIKQFSLSELSAANSKHIQIETILESITQKAEWQDSLTARSSVEVRL